MRNVYLIVNNYGIVNIKGVLDDIRTVPKIIGTLNSLGNYR